ncbi:hypothetical protein [Sedimentibacter sp. LTW-03]|uniref:hypothetical protein n=1 Tax=Sedimentibacter sp. LTW-03 TaxID=3453406 RepID=UPI003F836260
MEYNITEVMIMFSYKLNFLMNITNTSNSTIAHNVSLDASHVSRLRRGERKLPKKQNYLLPMSEYFARQIKEEYQKNMILEAINSYDYFPNDYNMAARMICEWLMEEKEISEPSVEKILNSFTAGTTRNDAMVHGEGADSENYIDKEYYYGLEGKREAVVRFLSMVADAEKPQTLLLFSDEELSWLYGDRKFSIMWAEMLKRVLSKGNRIKIIHTINRDINEMLEALAKWLPVYIGGAIEPYYYPRIRDGVFKRTLFIAPKTAAVVSTSVQDKFQDMVNFFVTDKVAVNSLTIEYNNYYTLCRPLMKIFNTVNYNKFWNLFEEIEKEKCTCIITGQVPFIMTMPCSMAEEIMNLTKNNLFVKIYNKSKESFENIINDANITEILSIPSIEKIFEGTVTLPYSDMIFGRELYYTKEQFSEHIESLIYNLKKYKNYNVLLNRGRKDDIFLYGKEDRGIIVSKSGPPSSAFAINEPNMSAAFWDYLSRLSDDAQIKDKKEVILYLEKLADKLFMVAESV